MVSPCLKEATHQKGEYKFMEQKYFKVLEKWAEYSEYDSSQTCFRMFSFEYEAHKLTKKIAHINDAYDDSGILSVILVKRLFGKMMGSLTVDMMSLLSNPQQLDVHMEMYNILTQQFVLDAEKEFLNNINAMAYQVIGKNLIGDGQEAEKRIEELVIESAENVINALDKCNSEVYQKSSKVPEISRFSTHIHKFPSLSECLLSLSDSRTKDGMYVCYIDICQSPDSYFGFFVKSNGNIFSVNERVDEKYQGQHQHSRNTRWAEEKADNLFPYDFIFSYDDYDYKGYSTHYMIDDEKLSFFHLEEEAFIPLLIAMAFLARRYNGKELEAEEVYVSSFLPSNITESSKTHELAIIQGNQIVVRHKELELDLVFDADAVISGSITEEFPHDTGDFIYMTPSKKENNMIKIWGQGFVLPQAFMSSQKLIGNGYKYVAEFVGNRKKMRLQAYYEIREQLATYMREKIYEEYVAFGGMKAVKKWYTDAIKSHVDDLEEFIAKHYDDMKRTEQHKLCIGAYTISYNDGKFPNLLRRQYIPNATSESKHCDFKYYDLHNGYACNCWITIEAKDYLAIEDLLHTKVPKIMQGWTREGHDFSGNSILQVVDKADGVGTPFELNEYRRNERYQKDSTYDVFQIAIGYSKRGLKSMLKEHGVEKIRKSKNS